jgi:hypothetical protein
MRKNGIIVVAAASMMATASTNGATKAPVVSAMTPLAQGEMVDCHVAAINITVLAEPFEKGRRLPPVPRGESVLRNPITGIMDCCAPAAIDHAAVEPAIALMKSQQVLPYHQGADRRLSYRY